MSDVDFHVIVRVPREHMGAASTSIADAISYMRDAYDAQLIRYRPVAAEPSAEFELEHTHTVGSV